MTLISPDRCRTEPASRTWSRRAILRGLAARRSTVGGTWIHLARRAMACSFEVTLASEDTFDVPAARAALEDVDTLEDQLTIFRETSAIADINRRATVMISSSPASDPIDSLTRLKRVRSTIRTANFP